MELKLKSNAYLLLPSLEHILFIVFKTFSALTRIIWIVGCPKYIEIQDWRYVFFRRSKWIVKPNGGHVKGIIVFVFCSAKAKTNAKMFFNWDSDPYRKGWITVTVGTVANTDIPTKLARSDFLISYWKPWVTIRIRTITCLGIIYTYKERTFKITSKWISNTCTSYIKIMTIKIENCISSIERKFFWNYFETKTISSIAFSIIIYLSYCRLSIVICIWWWTILC